MKWLQFSFRVFVSCLPLIYLAAVWKALPPVVPIHFDADGNANGFSSKGSLWAIIGGMSALTLAMFLLFSNLHRIDPRRAGAPLSASFMKLGDGMVLFLTAINFLVVLSASGQDVASMRVIFPLIGLLFAFLGNVMYSIKPNFFAGIRIPWTLSDDDNWRATHRVAGVVWFIGGLLLAAGSLLLHQRYAQLLMFALLIPMVLIPVGYSFWYFRNSTRQRS